MMPESLDQFFSKSQQQQVVQRLLGRVGLTRRRADCFVRLWAYLQLKQTNPAEPIQQLQPFDAWVDCTCREAAALFYAESERGSERSAGMMLDKLMALGLIQKQFDGNTIAIAIPQPPELHQTKPQPAAVIADQFDPRCDAIPVANLLASRYNWMNNSNTAVPYRITQLLRQWAEGYSRGMRVLRRSDNLNPVGFCLLYPTTQDSEIHFFGPPNKGLHLSGISDEDPFTLAKAGDETCRTVFIRSWNIAPEYEDQALLLLQDAQTTLQAMEQDFPNLCDLHTLIIHRHYEPLATALGFQRTGLDNQAAIYWMYLALDRFLAIDMEDLPHRALSLS
ncbi:hypothetical protein N836_30710 [Leptolyngbya sp. Heron Island J]|uniref:hypothetical protein n=1 Tax=Leptolyngbya sp. Heron Island J TaxID=1385935 RepID=UPI0003B9A532|nr:hypothetical protein [Leptolyngbya sp. Heron Island J]ESA38742.1 hypothetical protein N836_30710 [Leptolyngbya sp. Heron Island J]